jgi:hypothetical protein
LPRIARKLPIASAGAPPPLKISDSDWKRIEEVYGQSLTASAREKVTRATRKFISSEIFERTAEPLSDSRDIIKELTRASTKFKTVLLRHGFKLGDAGTFARHLLNKHFQDPRLLGRDPLHSFNGVLSSFIAGCRLAEKDVAPHKTRRAATELSEERAEANLARVRHKGLRVPDPTAGAEGPGVTQKPEPQRALPTFIKGHAWGLWVQALTQIAKSERMSWQVRKDVGNKSRTDKQSDFVLFVGELQNLLPTECRRGKPSKSALADAINEARSSGLKKRKSSVK